MRRQTICLLAAVVGLATPAAKTNAQQAPAATGPATPAQLERQLAEHDASLGVADWLTITQPGHDTCQLADYAERRRGELIADGIAELLRADRSAWAEDDLRKLTLLRQRTKWPLPADPDAAPIIVINNAMFPFERISNLADRYSGKPVLPRYPAITQIPIRMNITFQSTTLNAWMSDMTPKAIIPQTPRYAAMTVSMTPVMTRAMAMRNITTDMIIRGSITIPFLGCRFCA